jgi:hypothetical protein
MKTEQEITDKLASLELRLITNTSDVTRPVSTYEKSRIEGWVDALWWVLETERINIGLNMKNRPVNN